jgi:hypothetical protein
VKFQYSSTGEVLDDIELMVRNAEQYNGVDHPVARIAQGLYTGLKLALTHGRGSLGEKDEFAQLEAAVRKK